MAHAKHLVTGKNKFAMNLDEKVVIITGGTSGIGFSIVQKLLLTTKIKVIYLFELENQSSIEVSRELKNLHGDRTDFYPCDVSNTSQLEENFNKVLEKYKTIDILINNAGIGTENVPERMIDINYKAVVLASLMMIDCVGKHKGGKGGTIVNIASISGLVNLVMPIYDSTKHAIVSFTRTMKEQFNKTGIRVMAICPGVTDTPLRNGIVKGLDFIDYNKLYEMFSSPQSPENVANALITIIEKGKSGDVWVSEEDQPPYLVKAIDDYKSLRIN